MGRRDWDLNGEANLHNFHSLWERFSQTPFCSDCGFLQAGSRVLVALAVLSGVAVGQCGGADPQSV